MAPELALSCGSYQGYRRDGKAAWSSLEGRAERVRVVQKKENDMPAGTKGRGTHQQGDSRVNAHGLGWAGKTCELMYPLKFKLYGMLCRAEGGRRRRGWPIEVGHPTAAI